MKLIWEETIEAKNMEEIKIPWAKPSIDDKELNEVVDSFNSNWLTMGPKVMKFEQRLILRQLRP